MVRVYVAGSNMRGIYYRKEWHGGMDGAKRGKAVVTSTGLEPNQTKPNQIDPRNGKIT